MACPGVITSYITAAFYYSDDHLYVNLDFHFLLSNCLKNPVARVASRHKI